MVIYDIKLYFKCFHLHASDTLYNYTKYHSANINVQDYIYLSMD